jgi:N-acetylglutamate synthase-like GNAT family acetyltransferase
MSIRKADVKDATAIQKLLTQLGYPTADGFLAMRLEKLLDNPEHFDLVYEQEGIVVGFISFHLIPQITMEGNYALISYLVVDDQVRSRGVGKALEMHCTALAKAHRCTRILLHSNIKRVEAHRFYLRQGYDEYQKAFVKHL